MSDTQKHTKPNVPNLRFPGFHGEWVQFKLGELVEIRSGVSPTGIVDEKGMFPFYKVEQLNYCQIELGETPYKVKQASIPRNSIVFPKRGAAIMTNKIRITSKPCQLDTNLMALSIKNAADVDYRFVFYYIERCDLSKIADTSTIPQINNVHINPLRIVLPTINEQSKISRFISVLDERISTQNKVIEDLEILRGFTRDIFFDKKTPNCRLGDIITQVSERNKGNRIKNILSVSNKNGFINQTEQFEDRVIASDDTKSYKVVSFNEFAYNPARINVGSIARLSTCEKGIVSPMYICFRAKYGVNPEYLEEFLDTRCFFNEMEKRLEGSVRQCLSFDSLCSIPFFLPSYEEQTKTSIRLKAMSEEISIGKSLLDALYKQKRYFLEHLFI